MSTTKVTIKTCNYDGGVVILNAQGHMLDESQLTAEQVAKLEAARVKFWDDNGPWPLRKGAKVVEL